MTALRGSAHKTVDTNTMSLQYFDTLKTVGASPASKFFFPLELTKLIERALQATTGGTTLSLAPRSSAELALSIRIEATNNSLVLSRSTMRRSMLR